MNKLINACFVLVAAIVITVASNITNGTLSIATTGGATYVDGRMEEPLLFIRVKHPEATETNRSEFVKPEGWSVTTVWLPVITKTNIQGVDYFYVTFVTNKPATSSAWGGIPIYGPYQFNANSNWIRGVGDAHTF